MSVRKLITGIVAGGIAASVVGLTAGAASAATFDTPGTPVAANLIGVGSDTTQGVVYDLGQAYNATNPATSVFTYAATGGGTIALPSGPIARPVGSGAGKNLLYGSTNNNDIDFARSSSAQSDAETAAGLRSFPFALDTLGSVTAKTSNAPATLTRADLLKIYEGTVTNWSQLGGTDGVIKPYIPQSGSGTLSFFVAQLNAEKGSAYARAGSVTDFTENDPSLIQNDPNAVAPFSVGLANKAGTVRVEGGFLANRALYNVVRDVNAPGVQAAFGENGYFCSTAARPLIENAGFKQLAVPANGGACGAATQIAETNFALNQRVSTTTSLAGSSPSAGIARLTAGVSGSTAPQGTFSFFEGSAQLQTGVPLSSGQSTINVNAAPGPHTYTARFVPSGGSPFETSQASTTVTVSSVAAKTAATLSESFPSKAKVVRAGKKLKVKSVKGAVTVALSGVGTKGTGSIVVRKGSKTVGTGTLTGGVASIKLKGLKIGTNKLTASYAGDAASNASTLAFTVKAVAPKK